MSSERLTPPAAPALTPPPTSDERERVAQALCVHFAADHLSMEALEDRLSRVYGAQSAAQLEGLVADLPALPADQFDAGSAPVLAPSNVVPPRGVMLAILAANARKGSWVVPRDLKVVVVMGAAELDLRDARLSPGVTEIEVTAVMGAAEITVPPGVRVETVGAAFIGAFESDAGDASALEGAQPVLRVTGLAIMAGVEVKVRRPDKATLTKFEAAWNAARQLQ